MKCFTSPSGEIVAWVSDVKFKELKDYPWKQNKQGFVYYNKPGTKVKVYLHYAVLGLPPGARCKHLTPPVQDCREINLFSWNPAQGEGTRDRFRKRRDKIQEIKLRAAGGDEEAIEILTRLDLPLPMAAKTTTKSQKRERGRPKTWWDCGNGYRLSTLNGNIHDRRDENMFTWDPEILGGRAAARKDAIRRLFKASERGCRKSRAMLIELGKDPDSGNRPPAGIVSRPKLKKAAMEI